MGFFCDACGELFGAPYHLKTHKKNACSGKRVAVVVAEQLPEYEFDFGKGRPGSIVKGVWADTGIEGAKHSPGGLGSTGVFFLNFKADGGVVVFKQGSANTASEFFCSLLISKIGAARTPPVRVLPMAEFKQMITALKEVPFSPRGSGEVLQTDRIQSLGGVLMGFAQGVTLKHPSVAGILSNEATKSKALEGLGALAAVDMLINNFDRTPYIWSHEGNANNILFHVNEESGEVTVHAIDQAFIAITNEEGQEAYLARVAAAVKEAASMDATGPLVGKVRTYIEKYAGVDVGEVGCASIQAGFLEGATKIALWHGFGSVWSDVYEAFSTAEWNRSTVERGLEMINLAFVERVATTMADAIG